MKICSWEGSLVLQTIQEMGILLTKLKWYLSLVKWRVLIKELTPWNPQLHTSFRTSIFQKIMTQLFLKAKLVINLRYWCRPLQPFNLICKSWEVKIQYMTPKQRFKKKTIIWTGFTKSICKFKSVTKSMNFKTLMKKAMTYYFLWLSLKRRQLRILLTRRRITILSLISITLWMRKMKQCFQKI